MVKRYKEIVLEAGEGITFNISRETEDKLIVKAVTIVLPSEYSKAYERPPIPEGYKQVVGDWWNGFVIQRISDGSSLTWVPVGYLDSDGTLDGEHFTEKFGRRNYCNDNFSKDGYYEPLEGELLKQYKSVKKYGGFYISTFNISKNPEGKPQSVLGAMPWVNINYEDAKKVAENFESSQTLKSHLLYGAEYDSLLAWFLKADYKDIKQINEDSSSWGNFGSKVVHTTGSSEKWCCCRIYDFAGNVDELTQE